MLVKKLLFFFPYNVDLCAHRERPIDCEKTMKLSPYITKASVLEKENLLCPADVQAPFFYVCSPTVGQILDLPFYMTQDLRYIYTHR